MDPVTIVAIFAGLAKLAADSKKLKIEIGKFIDDSIDDKDLEVMSDVDLIERMKANGKLPSDYVLPKV